MISSTCEIVDNDLSDVRRPQLIFSTCQIVNDDPSNVGRPQLISSTCQIVETLLKTCTDLISFL